MNLSFWRRQITSVQMLPDLAVFLLFLIAAGYLFNITLFRWGDLIVDTFRDFYLPSAIIDGKVLYRDIYYEYGFFTPYFIAGWFKLFGISILSLALCGFSVLMATVMAIYKIISLFVNKFLSFFVGIIFLSVFAFGHYTQVGIFNFILPYSFASTFFAAFFAWAIYFFLRFILTEKPGHLIAWGCFLTLAFTARIEFTIFFWFSFFISFFIYYNVTKKQFFAVKIIFIPIIIGIICYLAFFIITQSFSEFISYFFNLLIKSASESYTTKAIGLNNLGANLTQIGGSLLWHTILLSLSVTSAFFAGLALAKIRYPLYIVRLTIIFLSLIAVEIYCLNRCCNFFFQYKALPVIMIFGLLYSLAMIRTDTNRHMHLAMAILCLISLFSLTKVFLRVTPNFYNFFLIIPGLTAYYVLFYSVTADFFKRRLHYFFNPVYIVILSLVFAFYALLFWSVSYTNYKSKNFMVNTGKGIFAAHHDTRTLFYWFTVDYLLHNTKPSDIVLVVPEGIGINFFTNRKNTTPYMYLQPATFKIFNEDKIIRDVTNAKVNYIIFTARDTGDLGTRFFGRDYAQRFYVWILNNYTLTKKFGPYPFTSPEFGIAIFARKSSFKSPEYPYK